MYHHYQQPAIFADRFSSYEWGRYVMILRNYGSTLLCMLLPFLLVLEAMSWMYAISRGPGHVNAKARAMWRLLGHPRDIWIMRKRIQAMRVGSDLEILLRMDHELRLCAQLGGGRIAKALDLGFGWISRFYYGALVTFLRAHGCLAKSLVSRRLG
jgi:hypothetical protein